MKETFGTLPSARKIALVGAAATVVAVFLPWVSVLGLTVSGISTGDGKMVLVVAAAALVVLAAEARLVSWFAVSRRTADVVSVVAAGLCAAVAVVDMNDFAAIGLYVVLLASLAWLAAAIASLREDLRRAPEPERAPELPPATDE